MKCIIIVRMSDLTWSFNFVQTLCSSILHLELILNKLSDPGSLWRKKQNTEWDTPIHVGLLHVRVHVEKSYQSTHVECLRDNIECYRGILATSVGRYFVTYFCVCYPLLTTLRFILFSFQFPLDVQFTHICPSNLC